MAVISLAANIGWIADFYYSYFTVIPDEESGSVIVGMIFMFPIFMILTSSIIWGVAKVGESAFNKARQGDAKKPHAC